MRQRKPDFVSEDHSKGVEWWLYEIALRANRAGLEGFELDVVRTSLHLAEIGYKPCADSPEVQEALAATRRKRYVEGARIRVNQTPADWVLAEDASLAVFEIRIVLEGENGLYCREVKTGAMCRIRWDEIEGLA